MTWLTLLIACAAPAADPSELDTFFDELARKRDGIVVLQADFVQKTMLPDEIVSTPGSLVYAEPRRIVLRTEDPERVTLLDGRTGYEYEPPIKQVTVFDLEDSPQTDVFFLAFEDDVARLREKYTLHLFDAGDDRGARGIAVTPKPGAASRAWFERVDLYLRDDDMLPWRMHIEHAEEPDVIVDIQRYRVNEAPDPRRTQIHLAPGTTIIKNDAVAGVTEEDRYIPEPILFGDASEDAPTGEDDAPAPGVQAVPLPAPAGGDEP